MSDVKSFGHGEFIERIAAYLSGGLEGAERSVFEDHRDACAACAAELQRAQEADAMLTGIFADAHPGGGFEDRIVNGLRTIRGPMSLPSLPNPMVLKVASGVAAAILLGTVGYVGNHLIQNNKLPGAARVAMRSDAAAPATSQPAEWFSDYDGESTTYNKESVRWDVWADGASRGRAKERTGKDSPGERNAQGRGENEGWRRKSGVDARELGAVVNGPVDRLAAKPNSAGEGKSGGRSGLGYYEGGGGGATNHFGDQLSERTVSEEAPNSTSAIKRDGATTPLGDTNNDMFVLTAPANTSGVSVSAGAVVNPGGGFGNGRLNAPTDGTVSFEVTTGGTNINGGTLNLAGAPAASGGDGLVTLSGAVGEPKSSGLGADGFAVAGRGDSTSHRSIVATPPANRYYQPLALGTVALGDALDKESKDLKASVEKVAEADEKVQFDTDRKSVV